MRTLLTSSAGTLLSTGLPKRASLRSHPAVSLVAGSGGALLGSLI